MKTTVFPSNCETRIKTKKISILNCRKIIFMNYYNSNIIFSHCRLTILMTRGAYSKDAATPEGGHRIIYFYCHTVVADNFYLHDYYY